MCRADMHWESEVADRHFSCMSKKICHMGRRPQTEVDLNWTDVFGNCRRFLWLPYPVLRRTPSNYFSCLIPSRNFPQYPLLYSYYDKNFNKLLNVTIKLIFFRFDQLWGHMLPFFVYFDCDYFKAFHYVSYLNHFVSLNHWTRAEG